VGEKSITQQALAKGDAHAMRLLVGSQHTSEELGTYRSEKSVRRRDEPLSSDFTIIKVRTEKQAGEGKIVRRSGTPMKVASARPR